MSTRITLAVFVVLLLPLATKADAQTSECPSSNSWDFGGWHGSWVGGFSAVGSVRSERANEVTIDNSASPWAHIFWAGDADASGIRYFGVVLDTNIDYPRPGQLCIRYPDGSSTPYWFFQLGKPRCNYRVTPSATSFSALGGSGTIEIEVFPDPPLQPSECTWGAGGADPRATWFSGYTPSTGDGNKTIAFEIAPSLSPQPRSVTTYVAGESVVLRQFEGGCRVFLGGALSFAPEVSLDYLGNGGTFGFLVENKSGDPCSYFASGTRVPAHVSVIDPSNGALFVGRSLSGPFRQEVVGYRGVANPFCSPIYGSIRILAYTAGSHIDSKEIRVQWAARPRLYLPDGTPFCQPDRKINVPNPDDYQIGSGGGNDGVRR